MPKRSYSRSIKDERERMVRDGVKVSVYQYEQLKKLKETTGKPASEIIKEGVSRVLTKKGHPVSIAASYLQTNKRQLQKRNYYFP